MVIMMAVVMLFPFSFLSRGRGVKLVDPYLGGANIQGGPGFTGSGGAVENVAMHNYYMGGVLNEVWLARAAVAGGAALLAAMMLRSLRFYESLVPIDPLSGGGSVGRRFAGGLGPARLGADAIPARPADLAAVL